MEETGIMNGEKNSRRKAQLPRPVYELLPYLYLLMALSLLLLFDDITRLIPGTLFALCGLMIFHWRRQHRRASSQNTDS
jgi:hypothetical protein